MNKFQKAGLAVVVVSGMAFAAQRTQDKLWGPDAQEWPSLQVYVPGVVDCWDANPGAAAGNPCYDQTGGWWFGYKYSGGYAEVRLEGEWREFGEGVGITDESSGSSLISPSGLEVRLTSRSETGNEDDYGGAGIGFNFKKPESQTEDINQYGGYCITYSSDGKIEFKLGHNETTYDDGCTFEFYLPASATPRAVSLGFDQFVKPSWCAGATRPKPQVTQEIALSQAVSIKLAAPSTKSVTPEVTTLTVHQFGWKDDNCNTTVPILKSVSVPGLKMVQNGRIFSLSMERAASVQVINLQGAVVYTQTITNQTMNLSHLPTGVYMVRIPSLGYTNKVILK